MCCDEGGESLVAAAGAHYGVSRFERARRCTICHSVDVPDLCESGAVVLMRDGSKLVVSSGNAAAKRKRCALASASL